VIHLIEGEITQPSAGTVTWVCRNSTESSKKKVDVFLGACRRERLKDDWQHIAAEFLKQGFRADTDIEARKVFIQFISREGDLEDKAAEPTPLDVYDLGGKIPLGLKLLGQPQRSHSEDLQDLQNLFNQGLLM